MYNGVLVTFGCSWTYGAGLNYNKSITRDKYKETFIDDKISDAYSFRGLISKYKNLKNINFASAAKSNQYNFRVANEFFNSDRYYELKKQYGSNIYVLWGITSIYRHEYYDESTQNYITCYGPRLDNDDNPLPKKYYVEELTKEINKFNKLFDDNNIKILWYDTFNHLDYNFDKLNNNFLFENEDDRDLLSVLNKKYGVKKRGLKYHLSNWVNDTSILDDLVKVGILNGISYHPTKLAHHEIADVILEETDKWEY